MSLFLSLDGLDGSGKSTQLGLLCQWLRERGHTLTTCRDPGSTPLGEKLRGILLAGDGLSISRTSEMLMYMAARAQLVSETIEPALARGETVVSDRFLLANVVYQGHAGGLDVETLWRIGRVATRELEPRLTVVLDLPADDAARRISRPLDRMERQGEAFNAAVRRGFLTEARRRPDHIVVVDAARAIEVVQADIRAAVEKVLP